MSVPHNITPVHASNLPAWVARPSPILYRDRIVFSGRVVEDYDYELSQKWRKPDYLLTPEEREARRDAALRRRYLREEGIDAGGRALPVMPSEDDDAGWAALVALPGRKVREALRRLYQARLNLLEREQDKTLQALVNAGWRREELEVEDVGGVRAVLRLKIADLDAEIQDAREKARVQGDKRAQRELMRLIDANIGRWGPESAKFVTWTYRDNMQDRKQGWQDVENAVTRLNRYLEEKIGGGWQGLKYVIVPEQQKRGAWHYHLVTFNMPYVEAAVLEGLWGHGFCRVKRLYTVCKAAGRSAGHYMAKYMGGGKGENERRLDHKRRYSCAQNLHRPLETVLAPVDLELMQYLEKLLEGLAPVYESIYTCEWKGKVRYRRYHLPASWGEEEIGALEGLIQRTEQARM